jgi:lysophospholipase L1-like esterase
VGIKDNRRIFTHRLEEALNHEAASRGVKRTFRVVNAGLGAATSAENLGRLIFLIHPYEPDLVVIQHGLNDVLPRLRGSIRSDYANYRRNWCGGTGREYLSVRLKLVEPNTIRGAITNDAFEERVENLERNGTDCFRRNTELMVLTARHAGGDVILASCPFNDLVGEARMRAMPEHNTVLEDVARRMDVPFFDLHRLFPRDPEHLPDGLHVSREGSDRKAQLYFDYLVETYGLFRGRP